MTLPIYLKYINNETYNEEVYVTYFSNITAHRFIYNIIDNIFFENKVVVINIIEMLNALFLSSMITIVLLWIKSIFSTRITYILLIVLAFSCGNFVAFGTNLYWIAGSMFLPMALSIIIINNKNFKINKKNYIITFIAAFIGCLIKQLFYFEFVSAVMIVSAD